MIKIRIEKEGETPLEYTVDAVLLSTITMDEEGKRPISSRAQINGSFNLASLLVMTRMMMEHTERIARTEFGIADFSAMKAMADMTRGHDELDEMDVSTEIPN